MGTWEKNNAPIFIRQPGVRDLKMCDKPTSSKSTQSVHKLFFLHHTSGRNHYRFLHTRRGLKAFWRSWKRGRESEATRAATSKHRRVLVFNRTFLGVEAWILEAMICLSVFFLLTSTGTALARKRPRTAKKRPAAA